MKEKNLILIDANNFFFRAFLTPKLTTNGQPIEVIYSIFKNLIKVIENIRNYSSINDDIIAFCDDRGYAKRLEISKDAVNKRIIPMTYKSKRRIKRALEKLHMTPEEREEEERRHLQLNQFYELLQFTRCNQVTIAGEEADDIIASYVRKYKDIYNVFVVSNDKDYYQLLDDVTIYNSRDDIFITKEKFISEYGLSSSKQWVDMGAIMGDSSDTIYGVDGVGKVGALKVIKQFGNTMCLFEELKNKADDNLLNEFKKYDSWEHFFNNVKQTVWNKTELKLLYSQKRIECSRLLKEMFDNLDVPELNNRESESVILEREFDRLQFKTIMNKINLLVYRELSNQQKEGILKYYKSNVKKIYFCSNCDKEFMAVNLNDCPICHNPINKKNNNNIIEPDLFTNI